MTTDVTTDSRKSVPGCLFVAITGNRFDGHDIISAAAAAGARGIFVKRGVRRQSYPDLEGCSRICELPGGVEIICHNYNASPASVESGLELLAQTEKKMVSAMPAALISRLPPSLCGASRACRGLTKAFTAL